MSEAARVFFRSSRHGCRRFQPGSTDLPIDAGAARAVYYDWDDINLSELLVRFRDGSQRVLIVDPDPPKDGYYANKQAVYTILESVSLQPAPTETIEAVRRLRPFWLFVFLFGCATILSFWAFRSWEKSRRDIERRS